MLISVVRVRSPWWRLCVLLAMAAMGCTSTTIEKSAQVQDANAVFERQLERATRFQRRGFHESAERHYSEAIATAKEFRPGDPREADARNRRAELRLARGNYQGAEEDYAAVVAIERRNARGAANPALANALNNLAIFYTDLDRVDEAEPLLQEAIAIRVAIYGEQHPYVAVLVQNLGDAQRRERRYESAEKLLVAALGHLSALGQGVLPRSLDGAEQPRPSLSRDASTREIRDESPQRDSPVDQGRRRIQPRRRGLLA